MDEQKKENLKMGFFKKVWNSIVKIEKYPDMAAEGVGKACIYVCKLVLILAVIICLGIMYQTYQILQEGTRYLQNEFPEFSYKDGILNVESDKRITISEKDSYVGKTIIDTKVEDEQTINQYIKEIEETGDGILILKNKVMLKNANMAGTISYNYKEVLGQMQISEFTKKNVVEYINSTKVISLYVSIFITILIYSFMMYLLTTLSNAVFLGLFGYISTIFARIKMRFVAIFNMAVYALTLSTILDIIYIAVNIFIDFNIEYFQVMYISVAAIYLIAAIFILKSEFMKRQAELMKIAEAQELVKKEIEQKEQEEKENKEKEEREKKDKEEEKKKKDDNNVGEAPEGSNA